MTAAALAILALACGFFAARLYSGPTLADRIVAFDALLVGITCAIAAGAVLTDSTRFLDVPVVVALVGFVGTAIAARFVERRGL